MGILDFWNMTLNHRKKQKYVEYVVRVESEEDLKRSTFDEAFPPKETVESVLNQFIELGHDKPVVVIKGVKRNDGSEQYKATIDGVSVVRVEHMLRINHINTTEVFSSLESVESEVLGDLKRLLNSVPIERIEITY